MKFLILLTALILTQSACSKNEKKEVAAAGNNPVQGGNDAGSGGDNVGLEFEMLASELSQTFSEDPDHEALKKWKISPGLFQLTINTTLLRSGYSDVVSLDDIPLDAINGLYNGKRVIIINRNRWREMTLRRKLEVVLHEYLGILKIEKNMYVATHDFTELIVRTVNRVKLYELDSGQIDFFFGSDGETFKL